KLDVYDSKFHHNSMGSSIFCYGKSEVQIVNSTFDQNSAIQGGALYFSHARDLNIKNCAVTNNFANVSGGFLYVDGCDKINLDNNKFASNSANIEKENIRDSAGGACMFLSGLFNCSIRGNAFFSNRDNNDGSVIAVNTNSYSSIYGRENIIDGSARFGDYIYLINSPHLNLDVKG
ncbi:MAG: hypothetical protein LBR15_05010, partial [Methanobrevibacter sp.]|nr:hypothetical protein [Candidatus Methanovirga australis]